MSTATIEPKNYDPAIPAKVYSTGRGIGRTLAFIYDARTDLMFYRNNIHSRGITIKRVRDQQIIGTIAIEAKTADSRAFNKAVKAYIKSRPTAKGGAK